LGLPFGSDAGSQTGTPTQPGTWSFTVTVQNCTGSDLQALKMQGDTAGWLSSATAATDPSTGSVVIKPGRNNAGQVVSWSFASLLDRAFASITVTVNGTLPKGTACARRCRYRGLDRDRARRR